MVQRTIRETTAMANNVSEIMSSSAINPTPRSRIYAWPHRKPVATGPSKLVLVSRSIHKSHYPVRGSARGNRELVLPRQSFRGVEVHRLSALDPWQACVIHPHTFIAPLSDLSFHYSGLREERHLVRRLVCLCCG